MLQRQWIKKSRNLSIWGADVHWLPHLQRAIAALCNIVWPVLAHFEHIAEAKANSADILKSYKSLHFVFFLLDVLDQLSCLSLKLQENSTTLSDVHQVMDKTYLSLTATQFPPGPHLDAFLKEAQEGVFCEV